MRPLSVTGHGVTHCWSDDPGPQRGMAQEGPHCHRIDFLGVKSGSVERRERSSHPRSEPDEFCQKMEPGEVDGEPSAALLELARSCRRGTKLSVLPIFWGEEWAATCREPRVFGEVKQVRERGTKLRIVWSVDGETQTNKIDDLAMPSFDLQVHEHVARARYVQIAGGEDGSIVSHAARRPPRTARRARRTRRRAYPCTPPATRVAKSGIALRGTAGTPQRVAGLQLRNEIC